MRITGGLAKNRKLHPIPKIKGRSVIRPTSDRVREALFSMIGEHVQGSHVLDLFAGTGSLGIEAMSRGAARVVFVDQNSRALELIRANLTTCFKNPQADTLRLQLDQPKAYRALKNRFAQNKFDLIFLDPPYEKNLAELTLKMVDFLLAPNLFSIKFRK